MSKEELGKLAERLVKEYFESQGSVVDMATDPFDQTMDMIIDGLRTEVKFQTIYYYFKSYDQEMPYRAFTVPVTTSLYKVAQNQLDKCLNAERWIIVQNPSDKENETTIKIWEAPPLGQRRFKLVRNSKDGRITAGFPMSSFKLLVDINHEPLYKRIKSLDRSQFS
jgi:hypothetical protein